MGDLECPYDTNKAQYRGRLETGFIYVMAMVLVFILAPTRYVVGDPCNGQKRVLMGSKIVGAAIAIRTVVSKQCMMEYRTEAH